MSKLICGIHHTWLLILCGMDMDTGISTGTATDTGDCLLANKYHENRHFDDIFKREPSVID